MCNSLIDYIFDDYSSLWQAHYISFESGLRTEDFATLHILAEKIRERGNPI